MTSPIFGPPQSWPTNQDAICTTPEFDAELTIEAYHAGLFPMPITPLKDVEGVTWWSPRLRGVLPLSRLRVTRSMRKSAKRYRTSVDQAFSAVVAACADPARTGGWIDDQITAVYQELHADGIAHSIECWDSADRLVGGLYGVSFGGLFAGESMFHDADLGRDASKVALMRLVGILSDEYADSRLIDVQWLTPHLASLGAITVPREAYLLSLRYLLAVPAPDWTGQRH
ncbi:MAG: leucyl/phenylalanyl-tRNA--protein transferase [Propionibacteriaceae bacterium]|nr:leucyl/phenylalanyl-tRNA--protein transferase [Propionibacteriaceae bacterium]